MNIYVVIVLVAGILSLLLQSLGLVTWGWLQININSRTVTPYGNTSVHETLKVSLWRVEVCAEAMVNATTNRTCVTSPKSDLLKMMSQFEVKGGQSPQQTPEQQQAAFDVIFGDFDVLPYLTLAALGSSGLGLIVFLFQFCWCCSKTRVRVEIISMLFWLVAVALLTATVGIGGHLNSFLSNVYSVVSSMKINPQPGFEISLKMSVNFPYSILLLGIGMGFCFVNTVAIVIDICVTRFKRSTDYWKYGRVHLSGDHEKVELLSDTE